MTAAVHTSQSNSTQPEVICPAPRVAYMMSRFPKITETFILYEMLAAEKAGVCIEVFPLRREKTTKMHEALWWMSYNCRFCGVGKWYCQCQWTSESPEEEGETDGSWMSDGSDFGWETETEDEEQDDGLLTPAEKLSSKPSISPEDATATMQATEKRMLFVEGK